jgi:hypothetical protein
LLLIVASELDAHADAVIQALRDDGFDDIFRMDLETLQKRFAMRIDPAAGTFALQSRLHPHLCCESDSIRTVWWRRASSQIVSPHAAIPTDRTLDESETYWAARWLVEALPDRLFPFSHPVTMRTAHNAGAGDALHQRQTGIAGVRRAPRPGCRQAAARHDGNR